ncbi:sensor histidine kinase [Granulicella tundricola]|uniref:histidine kinase n=1 Tax=Granulicella tundricola (strain ATCC BAA-1859 / DSM 23138 / MP5ACTX9) TaxID=1198114 RepID=E8WYJ6_GRATM|nr:HAMP domain-containing sensor histidine kinase [Granulicella tundricola]ADW67594.1 integral membrane sensor signal transduction histidine kinase [Granulicella tundricola MP5ACTX9]
MRLNTLRARVVTWYVSMLAAALVVFGVALYLGVENYLRTSLETTLSGEANAIGTTFVAHEEAKGAVWMEGEIVEAYAPELSGRFIRITRRNGPVLYKSGDTREPIIEASKVPPAPAGAMAASFRTQVQENSNHLLIYAMPYKTSAGTEYWIETGVSLAPMQRVLSSMLDIVLLLTPLILIGAAIGGTMLMTGPLQPLVTLTERAEHIGISALGERLPVSDTGDEMERLALSLNRMITRLEDALSHNRRFSADVSHELRTPLTIMRGELEQVLLDTEVDSATRVSVFSALDEISRMSKIVESLLAIARLDSGADSINTLPTDVSELCRWTVEQMHLLAEEKNIGLEIETRPLMVMADSSRIKQVMVNLIDNAIKYTTDGGKIIVTTAATGKMASIEIRDTGIGIPPEALPHVFDRFYRVDKVRARISGGTGLGLSIVKAICHAHGGNITVTSKDGEGTTMRVMLPLLLSSPLSTIPAPAEQLVG